MFVPPRMLHVYHWHWPVPLFQQGTPTSSCSGFICFPFDPFFVSCTWELVQLSQDSVPHHVRVSQQPLLPHPQGLLLSDLEAASRHHPGYSLPQKQLVRFFNSHGRKKMGDLTSTVPTLHVQITELDKLAIFEAGCPPTSAHGLQKATAGPTSKPFQAGLPCCNEDGGVAGPAQKSGSWAISWQFV